MTEKIAVVKTQQNVILTSRTRLEMTGIEDISSFDEQSIILTSSEGGISIEGEGLKIHSFSLNTGDLAILGKVNGIFYFGKRSDMQKEKNASGFFARIFK